MIKFKLPYWLCNDGAGSAILNLCPSIEVAKSEEDKDPEPFAESTASYVTLGVKLTPDGIDLYYQDMQRINGKYDYVWIKVNQNE